MKKQSKNKKAGEEGEIVGYHPIPSVEEYYTPMTMNGEQIYKLPKGFTLKDVTFLPAYAIVPPGAVLQLLDGQGFKIKLGFMKYEVFVLALRLDAIKGNRHELYILPLRDNQVIINGNAYPYGELKGKKFKVPGLKVKSSNS